jgi:hypothetical protein
MESFLLVFAYDVVLCLVDMTYSSVTASSLIHVRLDDQDNGPALAVG